MGWAWQGWAGGGLGQQEKNPGGDQLSDQDGPGQLGNSYDAAGKAAGNEHGAYGVQGGHGGGMVFLQGAG